MTYLCKDCKSECSLECDTDPYFCPVTHMPVAWEIVERRLDNAEE